MAVIGKQLGGSMQRGWARVREDCFARQVSEKLGLILLVTLMSFFLRKLHTSFLRQKYVPSALFRLQLLYVASPCNTNINEKTSSLLTVNRRQNIVPCVRGTHGLLNVLK